MEAVSVALASLRSSKLRSFLTLLGIILATTTLIAVMSIIHGMNVYIAQAISEDLGANSFAVFRTVMIGQWDPKKWLEMQRRNPQLNREEFEFLRSKVTLARDIGMQAYRAVPVHYGSERLLRIELRGGTPNVALISNLVAVQGRFPGELENQRRMPVAFLGNDVKERLFKGVNPLGKIIDIEGRRFEVIGVAQTKGSIFGESLDSFIVIPMETYFKIYGSRRGISYHVLAIDQSVYFQAQDEIRMLLRAYRHLSPKDDDNFGVVSSDAIVDAWKQLTAALAASAVGVVSVFMVVGGIVVMNIMLAVVTERTHEIGIRKSVGARRADILRQFLVESSTMAAAGGVVGVSLAWLVAVLVRNLTPVPMAVPISAVVVGVTLSTAVGLFFGIYPAQRAAKLDPIEALRQEK